MIFLAQFIFAILGHSSDAIEIHEIFGDPQIKLIKAISRREIKANVGDFLLPGDEIETGVKQIVALTAADGSKWKIAPNTRFKIQDKSKIDGSPRLLSLIRGSMWGQAVGDEKRDGFKLKIQLKGAALGVRGTEYLIETRDEFSAVDVLKGEVLWGKDVSFRKGSYVIVKAGNRAELAIPFKGKRPKRTVKSKSTEILLRHYGLDEK
jgi:ferric-dicitrate binding protein FerR (iron transport regulator)